ncbi:hypothetical protein QBC37DRAFT_368454 [Rhypophila decipiens]|uniref:Uncharacterized protein n=1 Tax=Rhypophila decipiens TaxID=261697 RepID=A0AAN6YH54_9PEZI|nr:hypothetical protein QBC37DRAFT_368454 [Rhypophila decipiens]
MEMDQDHPETGTTPVVLPNGPPQSGILVPAILGAANLGPLERMQKLCRWLDSEPQITITVNGELWDWMSAYVESLELEEFVGAVVDRDYDVNTLSDDEIEYFYKDTSYDKGDYLWATKRALEKAKRIRLHQRTHFIEKFDAVLTAITKKEERVEFLRLRADEQREVLLDEKGMPAWPCVETNHKNALYPESDQDDEPEGYSGLGFEPIVEKHHQDRRARLDAIQKERDRRILHEYIQGMSSQRKRLCWAMVPIWNKLEREEWLDYEVYREVIRKYGAPTWVDGNGKLVQVSDKVQRMLWEGQLSAREAMGCFRTTRPMPIFKVEDDVV